jgi:hypothetical protein
MEMEPRERLTKGQELVLAGVIGAFGTIPFSPQLKVGIWSAAALIAVHLAYRYFGDPAYVLKGLLAAALVVVLEFFALRGPILTTLYPPATPPPQVIVEQMAPAPTPLPFDLRGPWWHISQGSSKKKAVPPVYIPQLRFWYENFTNNEYTVINFAEAKWEPTLPETSWAYGEIFYNLRADVNRLFITHKGEIPLTIGPQEKSVYFDIVGNHRPVLSQSQFNQFFAFKIGLYFVGTAKAIKGDQEIPADYCGVMVDIYGEIQVHRGPPQGCKLAP